MPGKAEKNIPNCLKLAEARLEDWDSQELYLYVLAQMQCDYLNSTEVFEEDWETYFGGDKDGQEE